MSVKKIKTALISVYHKDNLESIVKLLHEHEVQIFSTGGTQSFIEKLKIPVTAVESITNFPSIFGGRVKTLHPAVFGGILNRRDHESDQTEKSKHNIPDIDLVIVDLYPFEDTLASGADEQDIVEKIDIGGISLIRAAAKNFKDVMIVSSRSQYQEAYQLLAAKQCNTTLENRKRFAALAFETSSHYDTAIFNYFNTEQKIDACKLSIQNGCTLRYGDNPHQQGKFYGNLDEIFEQLHGKELSYNNLVDVDASVKLIGEFDGQVAFAIIKHTNACGVAVAGTVKDAYLNALETDNISAFGGVLISNKAIDLDAAEEINKLFCEALIAPNYEQDALALLKSKKNRIILKLKSMPKSTSQIKSVLNGILEQDNDMITDAKEGFEVVTETSPSSEDIKALLFASKVCKHTKSNTIVFATQSRMISSGTGQTSRVDALNQAVAKADSFGLSLQGAAMASDAFFPFPDCVELAHKAGITTVLQPGGSIKDRLSIAYCNENKMSMVFTGHRHFKH